MRAAPLSRGTARAREGSGVSAVLQDLRIAKTGLAARNHLDWLESEAIFILREVAGECPHPVLFFSGGKDSTVLLRLAEKAFRRATGSFILIDEATNQTVAAGMIE
jgi:hypothetical protein